MGLTMSDARFPTSESGEIRKRQETNVTYTVREGWGGGGATVVIYQ